jgi:hypothetical protein
MLGRVEVNRNSSFQSQAGTVPSEALEKRVFLVVGTVNDRDSAVTDRRYRVREQT